MQGGRPYEKWSRVFGRDLWTRLSEDHPDGEIRILRDNPAGAFYHPCSGAEYLNVLKRLPAELSDGLRAIVLCRTSKFDWKMGIEARRRYFCVLLNAFPKSNRVEIVPKMGDAQRRHDLRWCSQCERADGKETLIWKPEEVKRYYLFHLFLHELGHINQPWTYRGKKAEAFAEGFALNWAAKLGELPPPVEL